MPILVHSSQLTVHRHRKSVNRKPKAVNRKAFGFTLIELLVVVSILGILISIGFYSFENARQKGRDSRRIQDLSAIKTALVLYYQDNKQFPKDTLNQTYTLDSLNIDLTPTYTEKLPQDPLQSNTASDNCSNKSYIYCYQLNSDGTFVLWAQLENVNNPQIKPSSAACTNSNSFNPKLNYCLRGPSL